MTLDTVARMEDGDLMDFAANAQRLADPNAPIPLSLPHRARYRLYLRIARAELEFRLHNHMAELDGTHKL